MFVFNYMMRTVRHDGEDQVGEFLLHTYGRREGSREQRSGPRDWFGSNRFHGLVDGSITGAHPKRKASELGAGARFRTSWNSKQEDGSVIREGRNDKVISREL